MENIKKIVTFCNYKLKWKNGFTYLLIKGDLTAQDTNVIVNAANKDLWLGGGVAGAIAKKGGPQIQKECDEIMETKSKSLDNGEVESTGVGNFTNEILKYIFHAVGPIYKDGKQGERGDLYKAFYTSIKLAEKKEVKSISFPPISSGIFKYPKKECAEVFYDVIASYLNENKKENFIPLVNEVRMVIIDEPTFSEFETVHKEKVKQYKEIFGEELETIEPIETTEIVEEKCEYEDINSFVPEENK
jgi:O-acetyl-ADP-ribose deacetylase (regulator of RNase III)